MNNSRSGFSSLDSLKLVVSGRGQVKSIFKVAESDVMSYRDPQTMPGGNAARVLLIGILIFLSGCYSGDLSKQMIYEEAEQIASEGDSYTYSERVISLSESSLDMSFSSFSGKETVFKFSAEEGEIIYFHLQSDVSEGRFKVCLVDPNLNISTLTSGSCDASISVELHKGMNRAVLVGVEAKGNIAIKLTKPDE